ncbi:hypothetical protein DFS33DRAFT_1288836 [Desarmillaria ectypa]|nr:hypothetical protein DFS33DRAFT_1288836 [Desarmillaria ectypa]
MEGAVLMQVAITVGTVLTIGRLSSALFLASIFGPPHYSKRYQCHSWSMKRPTFACPIQLGDIPSSRPYVT